MEEMKKHTESQPFHLPLDFTDSENLVSSKYDLTWLSIIPSQFRTLIIKSKSSKLANATHLWRFIIAVKPMKIVSGRWQAPAAVLPKGPKDKGDSHSRARRAREWLKHASPRARRARGRAKPSGACQCYYMFFTVQPKIAIFIAQFKYLNDGQTA